MSGTINFTNIPSNFRVPGRGYEVDPSLANTGQQDLRTLLITQMLASGTTTPNVPFLASGIPAVKTALGVGSIGVADYIQYVTSDPVGEVWILPVPDNSAGVAAVYNLTFSGTATAAGTLPLYLAGFSIQVGVTVGMTAAQLAAATIVAINSNPDLYFIAAVGGTSSVVTITAKHKGVAAGDIDGRFAYYGAANSEVMPAGITATYASSVVGSADPVLDTAFANIGNTAFAYIGSAYTGAPALLDIETFLSDQTGTWSYFKEQFGGAFTAYRGTTGALQTWGVGNNNQHLSVLGFYDGPQSAHMWAMEYTAQCAISLRADPGLTLTDITLNVMPPPIASQFGVSARETLLYCGISTFRVLKGVTILERACTTYQTNAEGVADDSYLDVETPFCIAAFLTQVDAVYSSQFARKKLVFDPTVLVNPGDDFVTAATINSELIAQYNIACANGIMQDPTTFAKSCYSYDAGNGVVKQYAPLNVINQLRRINVLAQFIKQ